MAIRTKIRCLLGLIAAGLLSVFGKLPPPEGSEDLRQAEFRTSTQRLGVRFTEKIRNVFRFRWIK